jgi:hypothetical protein
LLLFLKPTQARPVGRRFLRHPLGPVFEPPRGRISGLLGKKNSLICLTPKYRSVVVPSHGDAVPLYIGGPRFGDFLDLLEKIFFLIKYPVTRRPPRIEFFFLLFLTVLHAKFSYPLFTLHFLLGSKYSTRLYSFSNFIYL